MMKNSAQNLSDAKRSLSSPYSRENVRRGVLHYVVGRSVGAVAGLLSVILLVRHMDTQSYASYAALLGMTVLAGLLSGLGMERALARFIPEGRLHYSSRLLARFIWTSLLVRLCITGGITVALLASWPLIGPKFADGIGDRFLPALACVLVASVMFQNFSSVLQALVQQKVLTRILVLQWSGRLVLILGLAIVQSHITLEQALWIMAVPDLVGLALLIFVVRRYLNALGRYERERRPEAVGPWPPWSSVRRLALNNYGYNLLTMPPQGATMIVVVAAFLSAPFVAAYGFYIGLIERLKHYLPVLFMFNLVEPVLIAGYLSDRDFGKLCRNARLLYKVNSIVLMALLAWVAAVGPQLTSMLTAGKYAEYSWLLPVLILQLALGSHATVLQIVVNAVGKSEILSVSGSVALVAMTAAAAVVALTGRAEYLVMAPLVYELVNNFVAVAVLRRRKLRYDAQWNFHWKLCVATAFAYAFARLASAGNHIVIGQVLCAGVAALSAHAACVAMLGMVDRQDVLFLKEMLHAK